MKCRIILRSDVTAGRLITGGSQHDLEKNKEYEITLSLGSGTEPQKIVSLVGMPPGLNKGVEIVSFVIDGRELLDIQHLQMKDFCVFEMKQNPYVKNEKIAERNLVFNGDLICSINPDKVFWFPYHYSNSPMGFVYCNRNTACDNDDGCYHGEYKEHLDVWTNLPFPSIDLGKSTKVALGCSVTYGTGVSKSRVWPSLLGLTNFGVEGAGVDAVYYNLAYLAEKQDIDVAVLVLPELQRRLMTFEQDGYHFRVPVMANRDLFSPRENYFWSSGDYLISLQDKCLRDLVNDDHDSYSKGYLEKISELPFDVMVSSWSKRTYEILPDYFDRVLPFFDQMDDANDTPPHPGPLSHRKWAEKVQELL